MLVFMISGLWHGANWTFVVWGALHGFMLLAEKLISKGFNFKIKPEWSFVNGLLCVKTFVVTSFIWIFFRAESFEKAKWIIKSIVQWRGSFYISKEMMVLALIAAVVIGFDIFSYNTRFERKLNQKHVAFRWGMYAVLLFALLALSGTQKFAFIYFQF